MSRRWTAICVSHTAKLSSSTSCTSSASTSSSCSSDVDLDLARQVGSGGPDGAQRGDHRTGGGDVVVLDQRRIPQAHPVVDTAADPNRVLLQRAQPRQRLAGIADAGFRALDLGDPVRGGGGDTGQMAHQVEHRALGGQQPAGLGPQCQQRITGPQPVTVVGAPDHPVAVGTEHVVEHQQRDVDPGHHPLGAGHHCRRGDRVGRDGGHRGDVRAVAEILIEGAGDGGASLGELVGGQRHQPTAAGTCTTARPSASRTIVLRACNSSVPGKSER